MNGFGRKDLLAGICFLVFLGLFASSWLGRSGRAARRAACGQNVQRLLSGFAGFVNDHGQLPTAGRERVAKNSDWIHWQENRRLTNSAIATNFSHFSETLRCPGDTAFRRRVYPYSYSMNVYIEELQPRQLSNRNDLILLFEEAIPNDGTCVAGEPRDRLSRRHDGRSNAGFLDGRVELIRERDAARSEHVRPVFNSQSISNSLRQGPPNPLSLPEK
jgi:prepilin-type processing-associated H-X9-DG protein